MWSDNRITMKLNQTEELLFALLRSGLKTTPVDTALFVDVSAKMWQDCYRLAAKHGVMAIAWDGANGLPLELQPPRPLKLTWGLAVQKYEERYSRYCRTIDELSRFYAEKGIVTVQMKGVGLSDCYPIPAHREGGDIDIFTYSADPARMSDQEANRLADEWMMKQGIEVDMHSPKHSNFFYKGIPIENHKTFLNVEQYQIAAKIDPLLRKLLQPQTTVLDGKYEILTPSVAFNTVFLAFHAAQHYGSGLALHHLCDWACLIHKYGLNIPKEVTDRRFLNMIYALTALCNRYLGTSVEAPAENEKLAEEILSEILYPPYAAPIPTHSKWGILIYKTRWMLHRRRLTDSVLGLSLASCLWKSIVAHIRHPETIFRTR